jgi:hypothetical protein
LLARHKQYCKVVSQCDTHYYTKSGRGYSDRLSRLVERASHSHLPCKNSTFKSLGSVDALRCCKQIDSTPDHPRSSGERSVYPGTSWLFYSAFLDLPMPSKTHTPSARLAIFAQAHVSRSIRANGISLGDVDSRRKYMLSPKHQILALGHSMRSLQVSIHALSDPRLL